MWWKPGTAGSCQVKSLYPPERHSFTLAFPFLLFFEVSLGLAERGAI